MEIRISQDAKIAYPDLKAAILEVKSPGRLQFNEELIRLKKELEKKVQNEWTQPETLENVVKYNSFYKKFSSKVPMEFHIKSVAGGKEIPSFNPVLT